MVVAQIFGLIGGIDDRHKLLRSEFVHGVGFFLLYPFGVRVAASSVGVFAPGIRRYPQAIA